MADQLEQGNRVETEAATYGHHWKEADRVQAYVQLNDQQQEETTAACSLMVKLMPFAEGTAIRVLDIGSGYGAIAAAVLEEFPNARAVGLDLSEPMMEEGRQRMARFGDRFAYHVGDFANGSLPADLEGQFDLVVSGRAIHHLPPEGKQRLFADIYARLRDGGCFFNFDNMRPRDAFLQERYRAVQPTMRDLRAMSGQTDQGGGSGREYPDPFEEQLVWLREAGFASVDVFWRRLARSLVGGFKYGH